MDKYFDIVKGMLESDKNETSNSHAFHLGSLGFSLNAEQEQLNRMSQVLEANDDYSQ